MLAPSSLAAAHSMDTMWFAVDEDGHVAIMDSGEPGNAPADRASAIGDDLLDGLAVLPDGVPEVVCFETAVEGMRADESWEWGEAGPIAVGGRGLFIYAAERNWRFPFWYERGRRPLRPVHIDALPAAIARVAVALPGARFAELPALEPADFAPMDHWYREIFSARRWSLAPRDADSSYQRWLGEIEHAFVDANTTPARVLHIDASVTVARALPSPVALAMLLREAPNLVRAVLSPDELASVVGAAFDPEIAAQLAQRVLDRAPVFVERSTRGEPTSAVARLHEYQLTFESLVARGEVSLEWLRDDARRFIVEPDDWLALATREDAAHEGPMSTVLPTPDVLRKLATRAADTLAAESIAREITAQTGGDPRVVYWREAGPIEIAQSRALRDEGAASAAIDGLGFALDPVVRRVPVLLVEGREAPATPRETPENSEP